MFGLSVYFVCKLKYFPVFTCLLILLAMTSTHAQPHAANESSLQDKLKAYTWQKRILLVIADTKNNYLLKQQQHILTQQSEEIQDRDLEVLYLPMNEIKQADKIYLTEKFSIKRESFYAVLIGKDGGEKLRSNNPLQVENLFETIDSMPMRKQEMKNKDEL
jgi:hypothetical protein